MVCATMKRGQAEALDQALRCMFRNLEVRALPESLRADNPSNLLDQLLSAPKARPRKSGARP